MAEHISHALSTEAQAIDFRAAFRDYGVDSISGNNLVQVINQTFFLDLGTTILFDYSSIDQLTNFLLTHYNDAIATFLGRRNHLRKKPLLVIWKSAKKNRVPMR
ncbi:acyl carrier protein [Bacillus inaquosorum]|nr:acyl carrier protein [Bacillus inaquosorum]